VDTETRWPMSILSSTGGGGKGPSFISAHVETYIDTSYKYHINHYHHILLQPERPPLTFNFFYNNLTFCLNFWGIASQIPYQGFAPWTPLRTFVPKPADSTPFGKFLDEPLWTSLEAESHKPSRRGPGTLDFCRLHNH